MRTRRINAGFTLIELVMTTLVLAVITGLSVSMMTNVSDASRYEQTRSGLDAIRVAILGDSAVNADGHRLNSGYAGDWGSLPTTLSNLTTAQVPAWSFNTTYNFGAGWKGPYLEAEFSGITVTNDAWGNALVYAAGNPTTVTSYAADAAAGGTLYNKDLILSIPNTAWKATVYGTLLNGTAAVSGSTVEIRYPVNGTVTAFTTTSAADGSFSFSNVPFGIRSLAVTSAPTLGPVQIIVDNAYVNLPSSTLNYGGNSVPPIIKLDAAYGNGTGFPGTGCGTKIWSDISGNDNYGILQNYNPPCPVGHKSGWVGSGTTASPYCLAFDGINRYVTLPQNLVQGLSTSTIEVWFMTTVDGSILGMNNAASTDFNPVLYIGTDNFLHAEMDTGTISPLATTAAANDGKWHFGVITMAANTQSLYLDDTLIGTLAGTITTLDMSLNQLGLAKTTGWPSGNGGNFYFDGYIAYFAIYNTTALSVAEIKSDCLSLVSRFAGAVCN